MAITNFGYGYNVSEIKRARWYTRCVDCSHRCFESREGCLWWLRASSGGFRFCQCPLDGYQGTLPFSSTAMGSPFTFIQDCMINQQDYVELGLNCADICRALDRGMDGRKLDDLSRSVREAINQLTTWVKPVVRAFGDSRTGLLITEPLRGSRGRSSSRVGAIKFPGFSVRGMTKT